KDTAAAAPAVRTALDDAEAERGATGRIQLRPSGTEPLIRVMVEAPEADIAQRVANRVAEAVSSAR
ncbi:MAG: phosphoglucosamine mutase, partial [Mycobacterium sp.]